MATAVCKGCCLISTFTRALSEALPVGVLVVTARTGEGKKFRGLLQKEAYVVSALRTLEDGEFGLYTEGGTCEATGEHGQAGDSVRESDCCTGGGGRSD
eukprot:760002-Hanusia_phi.AAC.2